MEETNRRVELCMDWREGVAFARQVGMAEADYLETLHAAGITSVAIDEDTLGSMQADGDLLMLRASEVAAAQIIASQPVPAISDVPGFFGCGSVVVPLGADAEAFLADRLPLRLQGGPSLCVVQSHGTTAFIIGLPLEEARSINLGIRSQAIAAARAAGLRVAVRFANYPGVSEKWIDSVVGVGDPTSRADLAIFSGPEVLGYPALTAATARALSQSGMLYADVEFQTQAGSGRIAQAADYGIVRVHSITRGEVDRGLSIQTMADRYVRAARERNIRVMYMRPIMRQIDERSLTDLNEAFIRSVAGGLEKAGFTVGPARPLEQADPGLAPTLIVVVGVAAGCVMLLNAVWSLTLPVSAGLVAVGAAGFAVLSAFGYVGLAKQAAALAAAIAFPSLTAFVLLSPLPGRGSGRMRACAIKFLAAIALSFAGGLMLAGCLTSLAFMVKAQQFMGVKLMHAAPMLFVLIAYWKYVFRREDESFAASARRVLDSPILVRHALIIGVLAAAGLVYIVRTGNTSALSLGVPAWEQWMRTALEKVLPVRPRTKEFLLGHPAFILAAALSWMGDRTLLLPLAALAVIGQISLVNTFAHLHTPIAVTLIRVLMGAGLGLVIGAAVTAAISAISRCFRPTAPKSANREG